MRIGRMTRQAMNMNAVGVSAENCSETEQENLTRLSEERKQFSNRLSPGWIFVFRIEKRFSDGFSTAVLPMIREET